jgi:hypothetical protein
MIVARRLVVEIRPETRFHKQRACEDRNDGELHLIEAEDNRVLLPEPIVPTSLLYNGRPRFPKRAESIRCNHDW